MHWLHRAAGLVAEVECALVSPLRRAFDTAIKAHRFPIGINNLQATQASIGHILGSKVSASITLFHSLKPKLLAVVTGIVLIIFFNINAFVVIELTKEADISVFVNEDVAVKIDRQIGDPDINCHSVSSFPKSHPGPSSRGSSS
jgi:hypothetical protein